MPDANLKQCSCALTGRSSLSAKAVTGLEFVLLLWLGLQSNLLALTTSARPKRELGLLLGFKLLSVTLKSLT
jgi:hypothetical protein